MRVDISPRDVQVVPNLPVTISISIANTTTVIGGYAIRVLGADPTWVELEEQRVSLFPDEERIVTATITAPRGLPAGVRRIAVQVRELTPPHATTIGEVYLTVPASSGVAVNLDPLAVTGGRKAAFTVLVENTGNTLLRASPAAEDPESKVAFSFEPSAVRLAPGEHAVVDMRAKARRRLMGSPTIRPFSVYLDDLPPDPFFDEPHGPAPKPPREDQEAVAIGTFLQKSVLARSALSMLGLLAAITVFAIVITIAMSRLVGQSAADRKLALKIAAARNSTTSTGTSGVSGTVRLLTMRTPVSGVTVTVFDAANPAVPLNTRSTDLKGYYEIPNLAAGKYKIEFRGAGLVELWYPGAASSDDAATVTLAAGQHQTGLNVSLGGVPATISGTVTGEDVSASTLYLETRGPAGAAGVQTSAAPPPTGGGNPPNNRSAIVKTVPIGADGTFSLTNVPSPTSYELVVVKSGYAPSIQDISIGAGEERTGVNIVLSKGDGLIFGTVTSASGPLGDATITATTGQTAASTVSLTDGTEAGTFTLRQLPTPATYTLLVTAANYASQALTVTLASGQELRGLAITLSTSSGGISGSVKLLPDDAAAMGVAVTVTDGQLTVQTETQSDSDNSATKTDPGTWQVAGLPAPGIYTVTFSRVDLATETVSVSLDAQGNPIGGPVQLRMKSATAIVHGTVTQAGGSKNCRDSDNLGEATITLNSGVSTYTVTTATVPASRCGQYRIENVPPGTYTLTASAGSGTSPKSRVITLAAGDSQDWSMPLLRPASLSGTVVQLNVSKDPPTRTNLCGWTVDLYLQEQYPATPLMTTTTDAAVDGKCPSSAFAFDDIPAGTYIVSVGPAPGVPTRTRRVTVQASEHRDVVVLVRVTQ
jgi:hypothetical protein